MVSGKVQGVFFRASTARQAEQLQLRGWAKNLPDGRVEVLALGSPQQSGSWPSGCGRVRRVPAWMRSRSSEVDAGKLPHAV